MAQGRIQKQPFEEKDYSFDFSGELEPGETITLVSCKATNMMTGADSCETIIGKDPAPTVSGQIVVFWLNNGTDGEQHHVTLKVETSKGQKLEGDLDLFIVEE